jgi:hypothetical protein
MTCQINSSSNYRSLVHIVIGRSLPGSVERVERRLGNNTVTPTQLPTFALRPGLVRLTNQDAITHSRPLLLLDQPHNLPPRSKIRNRDKMSTQVPPAAGGVASRQSRNPRRSEYDRHQAQVHGSGSRSGGGEREREQTGEGVAADELRAGAGAGGRSTGSGNRSRSITAPGDGDAGNSVRKEKEKTAAELVK